MRFMPGKTEARHMVLSLQGVRAQIMKTRMMQILTTANRL